MGIIKFIQHSLFAAILATISIGVVATNHAGAQEANTPSTGNSTGAVTNYAPAANSSSPQTPKYELILEARLTEKAPTIEKGMLWRIFSTRANGDGKLPVVGSGKGGTASFNLPMGTYLVHAAYGRAGATKRITLGRGGIRESFILNAGGLKLNAIAGGKKIINKDLTFTIFAQNLVENAKPKIIAKDVSADRIIRLNAGTYHIVSEYGEINATVRADLRVTAGKLTEATLQHRAAQITLKLVSKKGGEAIADTAWSVVSDQGDIILESNKTFPTMILATGNYTALARNGGQLYSQDFDITAGGDGNVEVLAK